jgi:hypothetical protein
LGRTGTGRYWDKKQGEKSLLSFLNILPWVIIQVCFQLYACACESTYPLCVRAPIDSERTRQKKGLILVPLRTEQNGTQPLHTCISLILLLIAPSYHTPPPEGECEWSGGVGEWKENEGV